MTARDIRLFHAETLAPGVAIDLDAARAHYLGRVMRARTGDHVRLFNERDGEWRCELAVGRREVGARVLERVRPPAAEPGPVLAMAAIKRAKLELVIEKACELGASRIQPLATARGVVDRLNHERLVAIAREAAEQSERLTVPAIGALVALAAFLEERGSSPPLYGALERSEAPLLPRAIAVHGAGDLLIGPEGGFSAEERDMLNAAAAVVPVSLGARVLRAETAAIAGLAALALHAGG